MSTILCLIAGLLIFICCWFAAYIYEEDVTECSGAIDYVPASVARQPLRRLHGELAAMKARAEKAEADTLRLDWLLNHQVSTQHYGYNSYSRMHASRAAIDASMKEASK
jgi:hypothetical protein